MKYPRTDPSLIENQIPEQYSGLISESQYFRILAYTSRYFEQNDFHLKQIKDGLVEVEKDGSPFSIALDNLIKRLATQEVGGWGDLIYDHFNRLLETTDTSALLSNFQLAKEYLTLRLYGDQIDTQSESDELIFRQDLAGTYSVLSLDLPTKFQVILRSEIAEWQVDEEKLFDIARQNANRHQVETAHGYWEEVEILAILSNEYAAIKLLDLENNFQDSIGPYGALIAVPTKGTVFIHPIRQLHQGLNEALSLIVQQANSIYESDPGPITRNLYWYHQGQYYPFVLTQTPEGLSYKMPEVLQNLINEE